MAYADIMPPSQITVQSRLNKARTFTEWGYDDMSAIIVDGRTVICLEGGLYTDASILEVFKGEEPIFERAFEPPDG